MMEHSGHQQPPPSSSSTTLQQQQTKPRKHSTISLLSITGSSPISSMMLHIDPRLIPKNLFKFHKAGTDDEKMAMFERFKLEGIDPKKLNDSKRLPYVWRWLVDAEINCQSLRHQLEKMRIQHEQELQEVENYVSHVWKLSMERLESLQEENRFLHSKLLQQQQQQQQIECNVQSNQSNGDIVVVDGGNRVQQSLNDLDNNDEEEEDYDNDDDSNDFFLKCRRRPRPRHVKSSKLVNNKQKLQCQSSTMIEKNNDHHHQIMSAHSISSIFDNCHNSNVIINNNVHNVRRSSSCIDLLNIESQNIDSNDRQQQQQQTDNDCIRCQKFESELIVCENRINDLQKRLYELEDNNSSLKKLNRCIEIENENFAFKLAESESQSNQLEQRILLLEQELKLNNQKKSRPNSSSSLSSSDSNLVIQMNEQKRLIDELNEKTKRLEESLDSKRLELEEMEHKLSRLQQQQPAKESSLNFSSSSWLFRKNDPNNNHSNQQQTTNTKDNMALHRHTSDYYGSSDGFEEIKL
ncbi:uncharacterized protein LOC113791126 [Dermatophagoides pteronyssinus]|uniref:uncharacterized protein LOC113791126 n=1 Tax=Dermatophagoides pteronyssinus TaxID=6956 RepID=UPI003F67D696